MAETVYWSATEPVFWTVMARIIESPGTSRVRSKAAVAPRSMLIASAGAAVGEGLGLGEAVGAGGAVGAGVGDAVGALVGNAAGAEVGVRLGLLTGAAVFSGVGDGRAVEWAGDGVGEDGS